MNAFVLVGFSGSRSKKMFALVFKRIFSLFSPGWDWIQVEVTSDCNAACIYCPRTIYKDCWENRHLPLVTFKKLIPAFSETKHVHLQGWGEPFLHPDFFEMVAIAKKAGCRVGTTTNGMLLNRETIKRVVESRIDIIAFSLAGADEENDRIRKGTRLTKVLDAMRTLNEEKERLGVETPAIHVAYMLLRSGIQNLRNLPHLLEGCGVSDVVISFLDFIPCEELKSEVIAPATKAEYEELRSRLEEIKEAGRLHHLSVHHPLESMGERKEERTQSVRERTQSVRERTQNVRERTQNVRGCTENVQRAACISSDGSVSPCVYSNMQVPGACYMPQGEKRQYERMVFGNIREKSLKTIWMEKGYAAFRNTFQKGELFPHCVGCPKLRR
jgi:MoaA/NifB/PqqE/SkfB family radical SAM enzyme